MVYSRNSLQLNQTLMIEIAARKSRFLDIGSPQHLSQDTGIHLAC